ncbi:MAG: hypothetical protein HS108_12460 [Planctomycetes bacterium]|nr:hypothetical protein [Planctomycetota bacterium]
MKGPAFVAQVAQAVFKDVAGDVGVALFAGDLPGIEVGLHQQCLVVEHFLEVGRQPLAISGVAVKAAAH